MRKPPDEYTKKTNDLQARHFVDTDVETYAKRKEKQKWAFEKPKLCNARRLRGIYFIDSEDEEFKFLMKKAHRKLEVPVPAAMPCKTSLCRSSRETCSTIGEHKTKYACIVEVDESMRIRMEGAPHRCHEDHIAGTGMNS